MTRCRSRAPLAATAALALLPFPALAEDVVLALASGPDAAPGAEIVAEALFLCDPLPPGGRDLNVSVAAYRAEPDPATGEAAPALAPRVQLALAITDRVGLTADTGFATEGRVIDTPGASLKLLLRGPAPGRTGLAASLDLFGSAHSLAETEAGLGLGAIRAVGRLALRAGATFASGVSAWTPHLHAGASAALALGARWRALVEVVSDVGPEESRLSFGPTVKVALGERTALMAGALVPLGRPLPETTFVVQLGQGL